MDEVAHELRNVLGDDAVMTEHDVGSLTTYRVGGRARLFVEIGASEALAGVVSVTSQHDVPMLVVGRGSNLLVADTGFMGVAVRLGDAFAEIETHADGTARLGGAVSLPAAARRLTSAGLRGFEWAVGVPGSVGGAIRMNAGGHGSDMAASVTSARVVDLHSGSVSDVEATDLAFGYRTSSIADHHLVVSADLALTLGDAGAGEEMVRDIVRWRRDNQPGGQNAGSVFTNPEGDSAGRLIDAAGLKGHRIGTAHISSKHANFIQCDPDGSAADVVALMRFAADTVLQRSGVELRAETRLVGFDSDLIERLTHRHREEMP